MGSAKRSHTITNCSTMDPKEIHGIIKACGEAGVTKLVFGGLYLEFGRTDPQAAHLPPPPAAEMAVQQEKSILQDEQKIKQDILENLMLEQPQLYEELLQRGELVDGRNEALHT